MLVVIQRLCFKPFIASQQLQLDRRVQAVIEPGVCRWCAVRDSGLDCCYAASERPDYTALTPLQKVGDILDRETEAQAQEKGRV